MDFAPVSANNCLAGRKDSLTSGGARIHPWPCQFQVRLASETASHFHFRGPFMNIYLGIYRGDGNGFGNMNFTSQDLKVAVSRKSPARRYSSGWTLQGELVCGSEE